MLRPQQVRQLVILGFLFIVAISLLFLSPGLFRLMREAFHAASRPPPPPVLEEAPPPPPSPLPPGAVILDGALEDLRDATPLQEVDRESAYQKVVRNVTLVEEEGLRSRAEGEVAYATFIKYAPELRGRIFRLTGEAMQDVLPVRLYEPVQGREDVYRVYMWDEGIEAGFVVDLVDRPKESLASRDRIEIAGMFYKVVRYQNKRNQDRDAPLFVARSFRPLPPVPDTGKSARQFLFELILGIGIVAVLTFAFVLNRKMARERTLRTPAGLRREPPPPRGRPDSPGPVAPSDGPKGD